MQFIKARLRNPSRSSRWFDLSPTSTVIHVNNKEQAGSLLATLSSLSPIENLQETRPFKDVSLVENVNGYTRRITPSKRTVALGIFVGSPELVTELGQLNDALFEVDRIELGRRLDHSRWMNFVELASSSRWGEITESLQRLTKMLPSHHAEIYKKLIDTYPPSERIKGDVYRAFSVMLNAFTPSSKTEADLLQSIRNTADRAIDFSRAKTLVKKRLPYIVCVGSHSHRTRLMSEIFRRIEAGKSSDFSDRFNNELKQYQELGDLYLDYSAGSLDIVAGRDRIGSNPALHPPQYTLKDLLTDLRLILALSRAENRFPPKLLCDLSTESSLTVEQILQAEPTGLQWIFTRMDQKNTKSSPQQRDYQLEELLY